jgi:hypothetical protein
MTTDAPAPSKPAFHPSFLATLSLCGEIARRVYMEGEKRPPGVAAVTGTAVHAAVAFDLKKKLATGTAASLADVKQKAAESLDLTWQGEDPLLDEDEKKTGVAIVRGAAKDMAVELAALHSEQATPTITPIHVERKLRLELTGFPFDLEGTTDLDMKGKGGSTLIDLKTASRAPSDNAVDGHPQLHVYSLMKREIDGVGPVKVGLHALVKTTEAKFVPLIVPAPVNYTPIVRRIERAAHVVQTGAFYPVDPSGPSGWVCQPKWCGFFDVCEFGRARKVQV